MLTSRVHPGETGASWMIHGVMDTLLNPSTDEEKTLVKNFKDLPYDKLAEEEFKLNMIPFKLKRPLPNGKFEIWTLDELLKDHLLALL